MARIERDRSISKVSRAAAEDAPGRDAGDEVDDDNDEEQLEGWEEHVPLRLIVPASLVTSTYGDRRKQGMPRLQSSVQPPDEDRRETRRGGSDSRHIQR